MEYEIHSCKTFSPGFSNYCYIVIDKATKNALVVDPSWELEKIINKLNQLEVSLTSILLTHSHNDHVNLVDPLITRYNPSVFMSETEIDYYGFRCTNLHAVKDLAEIRTGNTKVDCLLTPGHTAGGMCYLLQDSLFTGDTIFIEGCGACDSKGASAEQMFDSIQRIKTFVSPNVKIYPGHSFGKNPGYLLEYLLKENIYFLINSKKHFVDFRMRRNQKGLHNFK